MARNKETIQSADNFVCRYTEKSNYSIWSKKGDRSVKELNLTPNGVKFIQSYSLSNINSISSKILLFLQSDPFFTPYGVIIFYSVPLFIIYLFLISF